jgi:hypothetical protein
VSDQPDDRVYEPTEDERRGIDAERRDDVERERLRDRTGWPILTELTEQGHRGYEPPPR